MFSKITHLGETEYIHTHVYSRIKLFKTSPMSPKVGYDELLPAIYDAAADPTKWSSVLSLIAEHVGARGALVFEIGTDPSGGSLKAPYFSDTYDPRLVTSYLQEHQSLEMADQAVFARHSKATDAIELIPDSVLAPSEDELLVRPNQKQMMEYGIRFRCGALLNKDQMFQDRFSLQFGEEAQDDLPDRLNTASRLLPHVAKALSIGRPLAAVRQRHNMIMGALDKLEVGICILNADKSVMFCNREFDRQSDESGVFRVDPMGKLGFRSEGDTRKAQELFDGNKQHGRFGARPRKEAVTSDGKREDTEEFPLCIDIAPLHSSDELGERGLDGYMLMSTDTRRKYQLELPTLSNLFNFTDAESSVLQLISEGLTNKQIAERRSRSMDTIGSQVKTILLKANCENRTQLIRMVTNISSGFLVRD